MKDLGFLDPAAYSVSTNKEEIFSFFKKSSLLEQAECLNWPLCLLFFLFQ